METPLFKKILFPVQFDRITIPALEMVTHLARQGDRFVYLLCVIPEDTPDVRRLVERCFARRRAQLAGGKNSPSDDRSRRQARA